MILIFIKNQNQKVQFTHILYLSNLIFCYIIHPLHCIVNVGTSYFPESDYSVLIGF